eukprot:GFKZ01009128.1.p2 GENE.GFKZ01009128.1~~GFKZ01009128.1.p2  ORF type:complete len:114 (-),score=13.61 GFKZ01009128.1:777-1118(-)
MCVCVCVVIRGRMVHERDRVVRVRDRAAAGRTAVYSREQIEKENRAMGKVVELEAAPWRLISIKGQAVPYEIPMEPITMMRNELISQGGSGVPIDRDAYMKSVEYWRDHAMVV